MHRFYLPPPVTDGTNLLLSGREAHHALHVLRIRRGERVSVSDGVGQIIECETAVLARDRLELKVVERRHLPPLPYKLTLAQAIPKGKLLDAIIQKATELGVDRIVPLMAQRVVGKMEPGEVEHKTEKWRCVAIEAIKQCGSAWLPQVETPMTVEEFAAQLKTVELPLVGSLAADALHPRMFFEAFATRQTRKPRSVSFAIGPEGDFTADELATLKSAGALPITLGRLVLRTETAAVYCLSIANYELQAS